MNILGQIVKIKPTPRVSSLKTLKFWTNIFGGLLRQRKLFK